MCLGTCLDADHEFLMESWNKMLDKAIPAVCDMAANYRKDEDYQYISHHSGSSNFSLRLHWDDGKPDWLVRFPIPGKVLFPEDKLRSEVALMKCLQKHTAIPVPEIIAYGTAQDNPAGLGPFVIMTWVEGVKIKDILKSERPEGSEGVVDTSSEEEKLNRGMGEDRLKSLYREVSKVLLELWSLDLDRVDPLAFDDTVSNSQHSIATPELTLGTNEFHRYTGIAEKLTLSNTFSLSLDHYTNSAELHMTYLKKQQQFKSSNDICDCREKYICRQLSNSTVSIFTPISDDDGPFRLFCDNFGFENILVDPSTMKITGVVDWDSCYAAPAQILARPPEWLLLKTISDWVKVEGLETFLPAYVRKFEMFLQVLKTTEEERRSRDYYKYHTHNNYGSCQEPLSTLMPQYFDDRTVWFNTAVQNGWNLDPIYWELLETFIFWKDPEPEDMTAHTISRAGFDRDKELINRNRFKNMSTYKDDDMVPIQ